MFLATSRAPRTPDIQEPDLASHLLGRESLRRLAQLRQLKVGRWFVNERRGYFVRVVATAQTGGEKNDDDNKEYEWYCELRHDSLTETVASAGARRSFVVASSASRFLRAASA